ncbi:hypothetical protein K0M31_003007 [Melipona bicolor]|uniref:Uncharacterized protein n=1 Tax=Melipona bicolor TaxID=60889 RepID=A0AA40KQ57_9HYME|nr:hypothetical protein K0M31_003007 [Melipona bicolor]
MSLSANVAIKSEIVPFDRDEESKCVIIFWLQRNERVLAIIEIKNRTGHLPVAREWPECVIVLRYCLPKCAHEGRITRDQTEESESVALESPPNVMRIRARYDDDAEDDDAIKSSPWGKALQSVTIETRFLAVMELSRFHDIPRPSSGFFLQKTAFVRRSSTYKW